MATTQAFITCAGSGHGGAVVPLSIPSNVVGGSLAGTPLDTSLSAISPDGTTLYVASGGTSGNDYTLSVISLIGGSSLTLTLAHGGVFYEVTITPDGQYVYVTSSSGISVVSTATHAVVAGVSLSGTVGCAMSPNGSYLYAANNNGALDVISTASHTLYKSVYCYGGSADVVASPDGAYVYLASLGNESVYVISTATYTVVADITVSDFPMGITITPDGLHVYVICTSNLYIIDTTTRGVIASFSVGGFGLTYSVRSIAATPDGAAVYYLDSGTALGVINTTSHAIANVPGFPYPKDIAFAPTSAAGIPVSVLLGL